MTIAAMETARLESLASEYRAKSYEVHLHPDRALLPAFLADSEPDMIALSKEDKVVVHVKSARAFDGEQVQAVAEAVEDHRPWRYEVLLVNLPTAPDVPAADELASDSEVNDLIADAELLATQQQVKAAALLAWSAVEAILRRLTRGVAPEMERQSSARVFKHLYALGQIEPEIFERLLDLLTFRNAVSHGFAPRTSAPDLHAAIADIRRLADGGVIATP